MRNRRTKKSPKKIFYIDDYEMVKFSPLISIGALKSIPEIHGRPAKFTSGQVGLLGAALGVTLPQELANSFAKPIATYAVIGLTTQRGATLSEVRNGFRRIALELENCRISLDRLFNYSELGQSEGSADPTRGVRIAARFLRNEFSGTRELRESLTHVIDRAKNSEAELTSIISKRSPHVELNYKLLLVGYFRVFAAAGLKAKLPSNERKDPISGASTTPFFEFYLRLTEIIPDVLRELLAVKEVEPSEVEKMIASFKKRTQKIGPILDDLRDAEGLWKRMHKGQSRRGVDSGSTSSKQKTERTP